MNHPALITLALCRLLALALPLFALLPVAARAQQPNARLGEAVPRDVREMYDRGLQFLATSQTENGDWTGGSDSGPGGTGLGLMVFLASGEDPNFGLYSNNVRRALRSIITRQSAETGILGKACTITASRMLGPGRGLRHGGRSQPVDRARTATGARSARRSNWRCAPRSPRRRRTHSAAGATRPTATTPTRRSAAPCWWACWPPATPASKCPTKSIDRAIAYYMSMTSGPAARSAMPAASAVSASRWHAPRSPRSSTAIARRKDLPQFKATLGYLTSRLEARDAGWDTRLRPLLPVAGTVSGRRRGLGEVEQAARPPAQGQAQLPTAASAASSARRSARRCRCWRWR